MKQENEGGSKSESGLLFGSGKLDQFKYEFEPKAELEAKPPLRKPESCLSFGSGKLDGFNFEFTNPKAERPCNGALSFGQ